MAGTVTEDLRIELSFETAKWKQQTASAAKDLDNLNHRFNTTSKRADRAKNSMRGFTSALGAYVSLHAGKNLLDTALAFDRVENRMKFATNGAEDFASAMEMTERTANELGLSLVDTQRGFSTIAAAARGSALEGETINELFKGITQASAALSLTADETNSVFTAFGQIISKGTVQAEELRGQIGERLPQAIQASARALGVTEQELGDLLRLGRITANDLLPKLAKEFQNTFGDQAVANATSLTAQVNRLKDAFKVIAKEAVNFASPVIDGYEKIAESIKASEIEAKSEAKTREATERRFEKRVKERLIDLNKENAGYLKRRDALRELRVEFIGIAKTLDLDSFDERQGLFRFINAITNKEGGATKAKDLFKSIADDAERIAVLDSPLMKDLVKLTEEAGNQSTALMDDYFSILNKVIAENKDIEGSYEYQLKLLEDQNKEKENAYQKLSDEEQMAIAKTNAMVLKQLSVDEARFKTAEERLKILKQEEQILRGGGGGVNFLSAVTRGSSQDVRLNIEAQTIALGAADNNEARLEENLEEQKRTREVLERIEDNLKPARL